MIIYFSDVVRWFDFDPPPHQQRPLQLHQDHHHHHPYIHPYRRINDADSSHDISTTNILIYSKCTCCYYLLSLNKSVKLKYLFFVPMQAGYTFCYVFHLCKCIFTINQHCRLCVKYRPGSA